MSTEKKTMHICTCIDVCGWMPCPYAGKPKPDGCPEKEAEQA